MPTCNKCGKSFPNKLAVNGKLRVLNSRKFCLTCSPFGRHNTSSNPVICLDGSKQCANCQLVLPVESFYKRGKTNNCYSWCKICVNENARKRQLETKTLAIQYKGGKCEICGYDRCHAAMEFHHSDPAMKEFTIGHRRYRSFESLKKELDKCRLLCCRCHREQHHV